MNDKALRASGAYEAGGGFKLAVLNFEGEPMIGPASDDLVSIIKAFGASILGAGAAQAGDREWGMYLIRLQADNLEALLSALNGWSSGEPQIAGFEADSIEWWGKLGTGF